MQCRKEQDDVKNALSKRCVISRAVIWLLAGRHPAYRQHEHTVRGWDLSHKTPLSLEVMARWLNPMLRGWINYYGRFYRSAMDCHLRFRGSAGKEPIPNSV
ncbi:group II intron maturase-specific domain-containing protein [Serratia symbiotica]|uniref:group II intron maturase-specific domain-containing protein n=1 Tax=Serratia symbiotica TaxID=138074 RepID=UPI003313CA6E